MKFTVDVPENAPWHAVMRAIVEADPAASRRWEVIGESLSLLPSPVDRHGRAQTKLGRIIDAAYEQRPGSPDDGWVILSAPDLKDVVGRDGIRRPKIPDLAGWRARRYRVNDAGYCAVAPDWVCEILSPSTAERDRGPKARDYAVLGIGWYWLVDLEAALLEVRRLEGDAYVVHASHSLRAGFAADPFQEAAFSADDFYFMV